MEVQLSPETQNRLNALAAQSGLRTDELFEDAMAGYLDEVAQLRGMLDGRYDDLKSGRVRPIDGEEAYRRLMAKTEERRQRPA
jgi:hypothetical protein